MAGFENDVMYAKNADFTQTDNQAPTESNGLATNGQLWVGTTSVNAGGTHVNVGSLTSPNGSITFGYSSPNITATVTGGSTSVLTLTGNSGVATPVAGNINVITANSTVRFVGSGSTLTQDFDLSNLLLGTSGPSITSASNNVSLGKGALVNLTSGGTNVAIGFFAGNDITSGVSNTLIGSISGQHITTSLNNTAVGENSLGLYIGAGVDGRNSAFGVNSLSTLSSGFQNTAYGALSLGTITTGSNNTALGYAAGGQHTVADSSNIDIGNQGVVGQSNTIRIGTQGSGAGQQLQTHIAGVINTVSGRVVKITTPGAYPYTTLTTDYVILVDTSSARTINLIASPVTGTTYRIKDNVGSGAANNITITPAAGNIDGSASFVIATNWGSADVVYNGTQWNVL